MLKCCEKKHNFFTLQSHLAFILFFQFYNNASPCLSSGIDEKLPEFDNNGIPKTLESTTLIFMINIKLCDDYDNSFTNIF